MFHVFHCQLANGAAALTRPMLRFAFLERLAAAAKRRDVTVIAFGMEDEAIRLILKGDEDDVANVVRGTKSGTSRALRNDGVLLLWGSTRQEQIGERALAQQVAWCHRAGDHADPLANPWTSHRDLLGFRHAAFFDATELTERVDPMAVHEQAGGGDLPTGTMTDLADGLDDLLRASAAVLGVLPANRRCFRLFVHLARSRGFHTHALADALMLTGRRIRQLSQGDEPLLPVAHAHITDSRLFHAR